jgi:phosphohistidine phosphatase SixA
MVLAAFLSASMPAVLAGAQSTGEELAPQAGDAATVFLVRHAEKGTDDRRDPHLSDAGGKRAASLARLLEHVGVTHLFSSEYLRTRETLEPLSRLTGVEITVIPARDGKLLLTSLRSLPEGAVAVVAGHSNTVPQTVRSLGGFVDEAGLVETGAGPGLPEAQYDRLFVVVLSGQAEGGAAITLDLRLDP